MPANVVKTKKDEKYWKQAKEAYEDAVKRGKKPTNKWAYVMDVFERIKHRTGGDSAAAIAATALDMLASELEFRVAKAGMNNQPEYKFFVFSPSQNKIMSGWEFLSDARENLANEPQEAGPFKVFTLRHLKTMQVDPDDDNNWMQGGGGGGAPAPAPEAEPNLPDDRAIDEMQYRQMWEGSSTTEAAMTTVEIRKILSEIDSKVVAAKTLARTTADRFSDPAGKKALINFVGSLIKANNDLQDKFMTMAKLRR